jgi:hypothetical protein
VAPVVVPASGWDAGLEPVASPDEPKQGSSEPPAVTLGVMAQVRADGFVPKGSIPQPAAAGRPDVQYPGPPAVPGKKAGDLTSEEKLKACGGCRCVLAQLMQFWLDAEHDELTLECRKLTTERAVAKTNAKMAALEARISELGRRREDTAGAVAALYREAEDLFLAIADARLAGRGESRERALRQRAAAVRRVVSKVECKFTATATSRGRGGNRLVLVTISPVIGEARTYEAREV